MAVRVVVFLEVVDVGDEQRAGVVEAAGAAHFVGECLHQVSAVVQPREVIGDGEPLELAPALAQPSDHVIEDLGDIAELAAAHHGQVYVEIAARHLRGRRRQPVERPRDQESQEVGEQAHRHEQRPDDERGHIAEPRHLAVGLGRRHFRHDRPVEPGYALDGPYHLLTCEPPVFASHSFALQQAPHDRGGQVVAHQLRRIGPGSNDGTAIRGDDVYLSRFLPPAGEASQQPVQRGEVELRRQGAEEPVARLVDRDREHEDALLAGIVPERVADDGVLQADRLGPALRQADRRRLGGGARQLRALGVHDQQLLVIREPLAHGAQVAGEPLARPLPAGARDPVEVLRHLVRAGEHAQLIQPLLDPEVQLARGLRAHALQLARDLRGE